MVKIFSLVGAYAPFLKIKFVWRLFTGRFIEDLFGITLQEFFATSGDGKCNILETCVTSLPPDVRSRYEYWLAPMTGFFWISAYVIYSAGGFYYKRSYMPYFPLTFNVTWEFLLCFIFPGINWWFRLGIGVGLVPNFGMNLASWIYGQNELPTIVREGPIIYHVLYHSFIYICMFFFVVSSSIQFNDYIGFGSAFLSNAFMSFNFIYNFLNLKSFDSINWVDAVGGFCRGMGTGAVSAGFLLIYDSRNDSFWGKGNLCTFWCIFLVTVCDIVYVCLCFAVLFSRIPKYWFKFLRFMDYNLLSCNVILRRV